jgi:cobalt-zinc-cadmium efflux system protein
VLATQKRGSITGRGTSTGMHAHGHDHGAARAAGTRALALSLALIVAFGVVEVVAGALADSLALLADAGHMASDAGGLALALLAAWAAARPATSRRSFGFHRAEILAALANGILLVAIAVWIFVEAIDRFRDPGDPLGGWMLLVGMIGLGVNVLAAWLMIRSGGDSLNVRAATRHVLADLLGSVGVILAALIVLTTGWVEADPAVSVLIGILVLASSWGVLRESVGVLLESTPPGIDAEEVGRAMASLHGVREVHDLHIWTITSGFPALSAHVLVDQGADCHGLRAELERLLHDRYGLDHTTLQVEHATGGLLEISR